MRLRLLLLAATSVLLSAVAVTVAVAQTSADALPLPALVNRLTWGATPGELERAGQLGAQAYIEAQLRPDVSAALPPEVQRKIDALSTTRQSTEAALIEVQRKQAAIRKMPNGPEKAAARKAIRMESLARASETGERATWRALYSPNQLQEKMTWFWLNHFNVYAPKSYVGLALEGYEADTIRPRALGKFRDLLEATMRAPAMLMYLDNQYNRADHINENYARELMELHTLGVQGGYKQKDVQELARVLTGLEVNYGKKLPKMKPALRRQVVQEDGFLFNPARHDYGDNYVYSALRLAYGEMPPVVRVDTVNGWLSRMGQPLYRRLTPDGYPMAQSDWSGSGQMTTRFDFAKQVAVNPQSFYRTGKDNTKANLPAIPKLADIYKQQKLYEQLTPATRKAIENAKSVQDANLYLLSSPDFMRR